MSLLGQTWAILGKEMLVSWKGRARVLSVALFGVVTLLLFYFAAGPDTEMARKGAPAFLVLALLMTSTLALTESIRTETEDGALETLLLLPIDPAALFLAKALSTTLLLCFLAPILVPLALALFGSALSGKSALLLAVLWFLAAAALAAPGTLYSAMTARTTGQDVLLPVMLFPLVVPVIIASVKAMGLVLLGDAMDSLNSWLAVLGVFDLVYWSIGTIFAGYVLEERR